MLDQRYLKSILSYNPKTGNFRWKETRNQLALKGSIAGTVKQKDKRRHIKIDDRKYYAHRLAFLYMEGEFPEGQVDHINRNPEDNRWINLRACTQSENQANSGIRSDNSSGYKGVSWYKDYKKWMASITIDSKRKTLGYFSCKHEAARVYNDYALKHRGEFARLNVIEVET